jgi:serine/threonine protein kinase
MLYELIAGRLPFPGSDLSEIVRAHRQTTPDCLRKLAPHRPREVARLVHRMLAKDPLRRPQTPRASCPCTQ